MLKHPERLRLPPKLQDEPPICFQSLPPRDGCVGAKIGPGKSSCGDCAYVVFPQNKKPRTIAAQVVRTKREIVHKDPEHLMKPFKSGYERYVDEHLITILLCG